MPPKPKELTRGQLTKGLGYQENVPSFLRALHARVNNPYGNDEDENAPQSDRPPIPTRPEGEASGDEESGEEKPQVVVLREGKHLSELEAENEKRRAKGLPPLPQKTDSKSDTAEPSTERSNTKGKPPKGLSFGSGKAPSKDKKRKVIGDGWEDTKDTAEHKGKKTKKSKKESKGLLSFGDGEE